MSVSVRIREFAAKAAPDHAAKPRTGVPSWLLIPGFIALAVSLVGYIQFIRHNPIYGLDLRVYRGGVQAFLDGEPVYRQLYTNLKLPFTYPPISLVLLLPLVALNDYRHALYVLDAAGMVALFLVLWLTARMLGYRGIAGRLGIGAVGVALMLWTEPFQSNFSLGQINIFLMLAVVFDLALSDRNRFKGIGIGLATAAKLVPGLFVVYLLLTRRIRAAVVAGATFVVLTAVGWIVEPGGSSDYWIKGLAFDSQRVMSTLGPGFTSNQSLKGTIARLLHSDAQNSLPWMVAVVVAVGCGLSIAVWAQRRGEEAMGMVAVALTSLLISPVSWSHHWAWIAPMLLVLCDVARRSSGALRTLVAGLPALAFLPFMILPITRGYDMMLPPGLIWVTRKPGGPIGWLIGDPYVPTAIGLAVLAVLWLRSRPVPVPAAGADGVPATASAGSGATVGSGATAGTSAGSAASRRQDADADSGDVRVRHQAGTAG